MSRTPKCKELKNTMIASTYGGWIYCDGCNKTIANLCYVTYDNFFLDYKCKCGNSGSIEISFESEKELTPSEKQLIVIKNRLCCPDDQSPLIKIRGDVLASYHCEIDCNTCGKNYIVKGAN